MGECVSESTHYTSYLHSLPFWPHTDVHHGITSPGLGSAMQLKPCRDGLNSSRDQTVWRHSRPLNGTGLSLCGSNKRGGRVYIQTQTHSNVKATFLSSYSSISSLYKMNFSSTSDVRCKCSLHTSTARSSPKSLGWTWVLENDSSNVETWLSQISLLQFLRVSDRAPSTVAPGSKIQRDCRFFVNKG